MRFLLLLCSGILIVGCTKTAPSQSAQPEDPKAALIARGKTVYQTNCTACHAPDPKMPGALGPDVAHSSQELIEARVLRTEYPKDYKPKRNSHLMTALPQLKADIPALAAYLNSLSP